MLIPGHDIHNCESVTHNRMVRSTYRGVIQERPDISVLHLVERIDALDPVVEQLVEDETDTGTTAQLVQRQVVRISVDDRPELVRKFGDDAQNNARRVTLAARTTECLQLLAVFLELGGDASLDVGKSCANVVHEDLRDDVNISHGCFESKVGNQLYHVEFASKEGCTAVLCLALVRRVVLEELTLMLESGSDGF